MRKNCNVIFYVKKKMKKKEVALRKENIEYYYKQSG